MSEQSEQNAPERCSCCTCGYTWVKGQHGGHSCAQVMEVTIADLRARLAKYEDADGNPITTIAEQAREISSLRNIISECATACGAAVSVECSEEFMAMLPDEIRTVMTGKSREVERLQLTCNSLDDQNDRIYAELAVLKAQPSGVVPDWLTSSRAFADRLYAAGWRDHADAQHAGVAGMYDELIARLNQPASAGDPCMCGGNPHTTQCLYEHFLSYSGLADQPLLRYAYFHGAGFAAEIDQPSAGVMDERAAFEVAYLKANYPRVHSGELSAPPIFGLAENGDYEDGDIHRCWVMWQARAALSAPSHGEQVQVPRVATPEMKAAIWAELDRQGFDSDLVETQSLYFAGIAAAPSAGSQEQGE